MNARNRLVVQADEARTKLLHTIEQLDHRRHDVLDLRLQLRRHLRQVVVTGGVLAVLTAGAVALLLHKVASAADRRRSDRWRLAKGLWRHPDRAMRAQRLPFFQEVLRAVLLSGLSTAVSLGARRAVALVWSGGSNEKPDSSGDRAGAISDPGRAPRQPIDGGRRALGQTR